MSFDPDKYIATKSAESTAFNPDAYLAEVLSEVPAETKGGFDFEKFRQQVMGSLARGENPNLATASSAAAGMSGIPRGTLNLLSPGLGEQVFPTKGVPTQSLAYLLGSIADPAAAALGMSGYKTAAALATNPYARGAIGGGLSGSAIGGLSEEGTIAGGGALGAFVGGVLPVSAPIWNALSKTFAGTEKQLVKYLTDVFPNPVEREAAAKALLMSTTNVAGERATIGMAAVAGDTAIPGIKGLVEQAMKNPKYIGQMVKTEQENEAARKAVIDWIAKPGQRPPAGFGESVNPSMAESARKNITGPLYSRAMQDRIAIDEQLEEILSGPLVRKAAPSAINIFEQGLSNARVAGRPYQAGVTKGKAGSLEGVPEWSVSAPYVVTPPTPSLVSVAMLKGIRDSMNKRIDILKDATDAASKTELVELLQASKNLDKWMRGRSQKWADAQDTFAFLSQPQNQAEVAIVLGKALTSASGNERANAFLTAMREAPSTIKKAGSGDYYEEIGQILTPTQLRNVTAVRDSLLKQQQYAQLPTPTMPGQRTVLEEIERATPGLLSKTITTFRKVLAKAGGGVSKDAQDYLDSIIASNDKDALVSLLRKANAQERAIIVKHLKARDYAPSSAASVYGADSQEQQ